MRVLELGEVLELHRWVLADSGGSPGVRDRGALESAVAQPDAGHAGGRFYGDVVEAASALSHALALGHPFVDGNKRVAHAALETMLVLNGLELAADVDELERVFLDLAGGDLDRQALTDWVRQRVTERA